MTKTFFEANTYYPIEKLADYVNQKGLVQFVSLNDGTNTHFTIPGDPVEAEQLPLVCDFLTEGKLQVGDRLFDSDGKILIVLNIETNDPTDVYPIKSVGIYTLNGWYWKCEEFDKQKLHIIKIERAGTVVAKGNRYKDNP